MKIASNRLAALTFFDALGLRTILQILGCPETPALEEIASICLAARRKPAKIHEFASLIARREQFLQLCRLFAANMGSGSFSSKIPAQSQAFLGNEPFLWKKPALLQAFYHARRLAGGFAGFFGGEVPRI